MYMSAADNINSRQRRTPEQIAADRQKIVEHVTSEGGKNVRVPKWASRTDISALESSGQLSRTVRQEFDTVHSPNFGRNGMNVAVKRNRAYLHLPKPANSSGSNGGLDWQKQHLKTANSLYTSMKEARWSADNAYVPGTTDDNWLKLEDAADEAEREYDAHTDWMVETPELSRAYDKHLDNVHRGRLY